MANNDNDQRTDAISDVDSFWILGTGGVGDSSTPSEVPLI